MISLHEPKFIGNENKYIKQCIKSGWISTSGSYIDLFEKKIKEYTKSKYVIALNNCTSALHISLKIIGVKKNDEVLVPTISFISPVNAINYNNAHPVFMDVDNSLNIDQEKTIEFINNNTIIKKGFSYNVKTSRRIKAIIIIHVYGNLAKFDKLFNLCQKKNIKIIEDAAESFGSYYKKGKFDKKHSGTIGDIGCLSFNGNKIITSGGGGAIITNKKIYAKKAFYLSNQAKDNALNYIHNEVGYNYRISNLHAAIGCAQIESIKKILKLKKNIHLQYSKLFNKINDFEILSSSNFSNSNYWLNILIINHSNKDLINKILTNLSNSKIFARPLWQLNHLQKPYRNCEKYKIDNATKLINRVLCLPSSFFLSNKDINKIVTVIQNNLK